MALLILPIGVVIGLLVLPPRRAALVTIFVGVVALAGLAALWMGGVEVSPLETVVLIIGTPIASLIAFKVAQWRLGRKNSTSSARRTG